MSSTRLKFELIEPQGIDSPPGIDRMSSPLAQLSARLRREEQPRREEPAERPRLLRELAEGLEFLIAQLAKAEQERDLARGEARQAAGESADARGHADELRESRKALESVVGEQQRALLLSMELMRRFEGEVDGLRKRMDAMESAPAAPAADAAEFEELQAARGRAEQLSAENDDLRARLAAAQEDSQELRAAAARSGDPMAAMRAIEEQRDLARAEAASARADLSIQSADLETKEALTEALERALEQQHGSLRNLEERFAEYATRLQELRLDRLRMPNGGSARQKPQTQAEAGSLRGVFKAMFSPPAKPPADGAGEQGK